MPEPEGIMTHVGDDGVFGEGFVAAARKAAGEDFYESKVFDDVKDIGTLIKNYANTKKSVGEKLDNVIQRPGENASDEDKAVFRNSLLTELGATGKVEDFVFPKAEDLPEGLLINEEAQKFFGDFLAKNNIPVEMGNALIAAHQEFQVQEHNTRLKTEKEVFDLESEALGKDWSGDKMKENPRVAFKAIMEFGTKELQTLLKESKIYDTPDDLAKWASLGFSPPQLQTMFNIGAAMKAGGSPPEEGQEVGAKKETGGLTYDHPSSVEQRKVEKGLG